MNADTLNGTQNAIAPSVEFFRLPQPGKRDPFFGLSRSWYYKAAALGKIKLIAVKLRGAERGVRLVSYASVRNYIMGAKPATAPGLQTNGPQCDEDGQFVLLSAPLAHGGLTAPSDRSCS